MKRAFYLKAKGSHPDTNPGDAAAAARFTRIKAAYDALQGA